MRPRRIGCLMSLIAIVGISVEGLRAQQKTNEANGSKVPPTQTRRENVYRLDYSLRELENGESTNSRSYTLMVTAPDSVFNPSGFGSRAGFHVGSRIPMSIGKDQIQYFDL